jgi:hypothetical protein
MLLMKQLKERSFSKQPKELQHASLKITYFVWYHILKPNCLPPPSTFTMDTFLTSAITNRTDSYSEEINAAARYAINNMETFQILCNILRCHITSLFEQHLADNLELVNITNKDFTLATSQIHKLFLSEDYCKGLNHCLWSWMEQNYRWATDSCYTIGIPIVPIIDLWSRKAN